MQIAKRQIKLISVIVLFTALMTWFYYAHESFPKPLRALTALVATPVAVASGLSHYLRSCLEFYQN